MKTLNIHEIKKIIEKNFTIQVHSIKWIGSGNDSNAYEINDTIVFKFPKHKKASINLEKEIEILQYLQNRLSYNIPKVLYIGEPNSEYAYRFAGFSKIEGVSLSKELYAKLTKTKQEQLAKDLAIFLKELHSLDYKKYKVDMMQCYKKDYVTLKQLLFERLNEKEKQKIENVYTTIFSNEDFQSIENVLVHNDFSCTNILYDVEKGRIAGVIDFGDACVTDRDNDFYCLLEESDEELGRDFGLQVLNNYGYKDVDKLVRKSDFHEYYWQFEEILYGYEYGYQDWIEEGLEKLKLDS